MSSLHSELYATLLCLSLLLLGAAAAGGEQLGDKQQQKHQHQQQQQQLELKLSALRVHKQLLQAELARLYMGTFTPEMPMLVEELQQRQRDIQRQIDKLEGKAHQQDAQQLALNLAADFEFLQHKLNELKVQLDALQANRTSTTTSSSSTTSTSTSTTKHELTREVVHSSTPRAPVGSYFFTPLLAMPESGPSGGIAQPEPNATPSLIKRVLAMLRPNAASSTSSSPVSLLRGSQWSESTSQQQQSQSQQQQQHQVQLLNAEELLSQLQLQRQFLDDAIKRMELLSVKQSNKF